VPLTIFAVSSLFIYAVLNRLLFKWRNIQLTLTLALLHKRLGFIPPETSPAKPTPLRTDNVMPHKMLRFSLPIKLPRCPLSICSHLLPFSLPFTQPLHKAANYNLPNQSKYSMKGDSLKHCWKSPQAYSRIRPVHGDRMDSSTVIYPLNGQQF
jgi:hypothetical protein